MKKSIVLSAFLIAASLTLTSCWDKVEGEPETHVQGEPATAPADSLAQPETAAAPADSVTHAHADAPEVVAPATTTGKK